MIKHTMKLPIKAIRANEDSNGSELFKPDDGETYPYVRITDVNDMTVVANHDRFEFRQGDAEFLVLAANMHNKLTSFAEQVADSIQADIDNDWTHAIHPNVLTEMEKQVERIREMVKRARGES